MKKLAGVGAMLLLPLNVLAHPGHDYWVENRLVDFITQDSFIVFTPVLLGLIYALIRMNLLKSPDSDHSDKTS